MEVNKKSKIILIALLFIIITAQMGRIIYVFAFEREGYHSDESYSYGFANSYNDPYIYVDSDGIEKNFNAWTSAKVFRDFIVVNEDEKFSYASVYNNQKKDMSPPFHSMLLHTISSIFPETFSWNYAFIINIVCFVLTQITLFFLVFSLTQSRWAGLMTCLFYGFTTGALNSFVYLRMYALLTFLAVLVSYLHSRMYNKAFQKIGRELIYLVGVTIIGVMTHYYFYVFSFFTTALYCIYLLAKRRWRALIAYAGSMLLAVGLSFAIYPYALSNMIGGSSVYDKQMPYAWNLKYCFSAMISEITGMYVWYPDPAALVILIAAIVVIMILGAALGFLFRNEVWFPKIIGKIKKSPRRVRVFVTRTIRNLHWPVVFLFLTTLATLAIIAKISLIYGMGIFADRYLFFIMPLLCAGLVGCGYAITSKIPLRPRLQQLILLAGVLLVLVMNNYWTGCNYLFKKENTGTAIEEQTRNSNCIIVTKSAWHLTCYTTLLRDSSHFFAVLGSACMQQGEALAKVDTSLPTYVVIETSMFPDKDGKLPGLESIKLEEGAHLGLDYTEQQFLDYLAMQDWVTQVTYISTEKGFTGVIDIYQLN